MTIVDVVLEEERDEVKRFLKRFCLRYENDIDQTIVLKEKDQIIATASASNNIIKCIAIEPDYQGQNLLSLLMSEMIKRLSKAGIDHYFVYTMDEQVPLFKALGLKPIVQTMTLSLLEGGSDITISLKELKSEYELSEKEKACIVVNANPLTKGHEYLIETVATKHDDVIVFVVSEDRSVFPFDVRFEIVKKACARFNNVRVLPTLEYLVSYATFPKYFLKEEVNIAEEHALIDVLIFKTYYMKVLNIKHRYVGEEPLSPMTQMYNKTMKKYLKDTLYIIPRKEFKCRPISASIVRGLLRKNGIDAVKPYLPQATLDFLCTQEGRDCIEKLKQRAHQRH